MQCSSMQGLCAQLTGGSTSQLYICMQCSSMQGLCAHLTGSQYPFSLSLSLYIYICSVAVCKASVLD